MISMMTIIWIVLVLRFHMIQRMDGLIAIAIDAGNLTDCAEDAINSTDCADTNVLDDAVDKLMMLMS